MATPFDLNSVLNARSDLSYSATSGREDFHLKLLAYADATPGDYSISAKDNPEQESELQTAYSRLRKLDGNGDDSVTLQEAIAATGGRLQALQTESQAKRDAYQKALDDLPYPRSREAVDALEPLRAAMQVAHDRYSHEITFHNDLLTLQLKEKRQ